MLNYTVKSIPKEQTYNWLLKKHYARVIPCIMYSFGLYDQENILQGVCCFGTPANNFNNNLGRFKCIELVRLVVNETLNKNSLSFFVSSCLKMLEKPLVVISYADEGKNHHGYIYQATNWLYTGKGGGVDFYVDVNGQEHHSRVMSDYRLKYPEKSRSQIAEMLQWSIEKGTYKHRYFYFLGNNKDKKEMMRELEQRYKLAPYPKGDNIRYDASYEPKVNLCLF